MSSVVKFSDDRFGLYEGTWVPLEQPMVEATYDAREVELNKPSRKRWIKVRHK